MGAHNYRKGSFYDSCKSNSGQSFVSGEVQRLKCKMGLFNFGEFFWKISTQSMILDFFFTYNEAVTRTQPEQTGFAYHIDNICILCQGQGGDFPYLWKKKDATAVGGSPDAEDTCKVVSTNPGHDMMGGDLHVEPSPSIEACGAACCAWKGCGGFVYITRRVVSHLTDITPHPTDITRGLKTHSTHLDLDSQEDPKACGTTNTGCCFIKPVKLPKVEKSGWKTIVSGVVTGGVPAPTCEDKNSTHHMDTVGSVVQSKSDVSSWQVCVWDAGGHAIYYA